MSCLLPFLRNVSLWLNTINVECILKSNLENKSHMPGHVTSVLNTAFQCCIVPQLVGCFVFFSAPLTQLPAWQRHRAAKGGRSSQTIGRKKMYLARQLDRADFYAETWLIHLFNQSSNISSFKKQSASFM